MAKYIIVNHQQTKYEGKLKKATQYYGGVLMAGAVQVQRWDVHSKKDAYVFSTLAEAKRYFKKHKLDICNDYDWVKIQWNWYQKDNYEIVKVS